MTQMRRQPDRPRLCLVSHAAYGAMTGGTTGHIGGVERQTSFTARWFAARGYPTSLVTWGEGPVEDEWVDGVQIIKVCPRGAGVPGLRFFHPRWTSLRTALGRADADVCYQNCAEEVTGQVALWCRRYGRPFVYSVASQADCDPRLPTLRRRRERILYRYGLRHADQVIVQTRTQQRMLREGFGRESVVIPMPCSGPSDAEFVEPDPPAEGRFRVLWVGRICREKRPDRLLDLAAALPELVFDVAGPFGEDAYSQSVRQRAALLGNVTVHGGVNRDRMPDFYRGAGCLCCTSDVEGFPNTFLEAWSHGLPVVTTFDPDGLVAEHGLGFPARDVPSLAAALRALATDLGAWRTASRNGRRYYVENHRVDVVLPRFEEVFINVVRQAGRS
jgi:glycosyltransferase involved in cell wall biosynthesis